MARRTNVQFTKLCIPLTQSILLEGPMFGRCIGLLRYTKQTVLFITRWLSRDRPFDLNTMLLSDYRRMLRRRSVSIEGQMISSNDKQSVSNYFRKKYQTSFILSWANGKLTIFFSIDFRGFLASRWGQCWQLRIFCSNIFGNFYCTDSGLETFSVVKIKKIFVSINLILNFRILTVTHCTWSHNRLIWIIFCTLENFCTLEI